MECEHDGCRQIAEFYDPVENRLCSDCVTMEVETGEYSWDDCVAIHDKAIKPTGESVAAYQQPVRKILW